MEISLRAPTVSVTPLGRQKHAKNLRVNFLASAKPIHKAHDIAKLPENVSNIIFSQFQP